ncbi:diguanylate cyclase [candidate division CSSED10-310 bacterium]|uniref:Diguanylate cyclase n=1 Tax=candidate division CSSED10-310 bacterium TaxID=2855610 RepID=A0ABV6YR97_UNCC1
MKKKEKPNSQSSLNSPLEPFFEIKDEVLLLKKYVDTLLGEKPATQISLKQFPNFRALAQSIDQLRSKIQELQKEHFFFKKVKDDWKQRSRELELLQELSKKINATHDKSIVLEFMVSFVEKLLDSKGCMVFLFDHEMDDMPIKSFSNVETHDEELLKDVMATEELDWAITGKKPTIIPHMLMSNKQQGKRTEGSIIVVPFWVEDMILGVLLNLSPKPRHSFFEEDLEILSMIANNISVALQNAIQHHEMLNKINDLSIMVEAGKSMSSIRDLDELLQTIISLITQVASWKAGILLLYNEESKQLEPLNQIGLENYQRQEFYLSLGEGISGFVAEKRTPIFINSLKQKKFFKDAREFSVLGKGTLFSIPLENKSRLIGVLNLYNNDETYSLTESHQDMILSLAQHASITLDNVLLYKQTEEHAFHDDLTNLYNARFLKQYLEDIIQKCKRANSELGLIVIDLDEFQKLNDLHGHQMGSWALKEVSHILTFITGRHDFVCRYGGGEFIIARSGASLEKTIKTAQKIQKTIETYSFLTDHDLKYHLTVSIGVAGYPSSAQSAKELIELADHFLFKSRKPGLESKRAGGEPALLTKDSLV